MGGVRIFGKSSDYNELSDEDKIRNAVVDFIETNQVAKINHSAIAEKTGISRKNVENILSKMKFNSSDSPMKSLSPQVLTHLYEMTKKSVAACKLWFEIMENFAETQNVNINQSLFLTVPDAPEARTAAEQYLKALKSNSLVVSKN